MWIKLWSYSDLGCFKNNTLFYYFRKRLVLSSKLHERCHLSIISRPPTRSWLILCWDSSSPMCASSWSPRRAGRYLWRWSRQWRYRRPSCRDRLLFCRRAHRKHRSENRRRRPIAPRGCDRVCYRIQRRCSGGDQAGGWLTHALSTHLRLPLRARYKGRRHYFAFCRCRFCLTFRSCYILPLTARIK